MILSRKTYGPLLAAIAICTANPLVAADKGDETVSDEDALGIEQAMERGLALYRHDQAAWHTTDALREDIADLGGSGIVGWVVTEEDGGHRVTFWKPDG